MVLLVSKLASREQIETFAICAPGTEVGCRRLMYGAYYTEQDVERAEYAKAVSNGDEILAGLQRATSLVLISHQEPVEASALQTLLVSSGPDLEKVVLLSKIGVSKEVRNFWSGPNDLKWSESEREIRQICQERKLVLSIVRAGTLKGGGPGGGGNDFGLSQSYYNTLFDSVEASVTMAHDKYTLGVECFLGDPVEMPNFLTQFSLRSSFEPAIFETNRIVAASAVVASMLHDSSVEFTVSSAKGTKPPTIQDWRTILESVKKS
jgi:hypothetical protein